MNKTNTFSHEERLKSKKRIDLLFSAGQSFHIRPFHVYWKLVDFNATDNKQYHSQIMISISKRHFKKAPDRNKIKRLIREGYRKNKDILKNYMVDSQKLLIFGIIYTSGIIPSAQKMEEGIISILDHLIEELPNEIPIADD